MTNYICEICTNAGIDFNRQIYIEFDLVHEQETFDEESEQTIIFDRIQTNLLITNNTSSSVTRQQIEDLVLRQEITGNVIIDTIPLDTRNECHIPNIHQIKCSCGRTMISRNESIRLNNPLLRTPSWAENLRMSDNVESVQLFEGNTLFLKNIQIGFLVFGLSNGQITRFTLSKEGYPNITVSTKYDFHSNFGTIKRLISEQSTGLKIKIRRRINLKFDFENNTQINDRITKTTVNEVTTDLLMNILDFLEIPINLLDYSKRSYEFEDANSLNDEGTNENIIQWFDLSQTYYDFDFGVIDRHETETSGYTSQIDFINNYENFMRERCTTPITSNVPLLSLNDTT